MLDLLFRVPLKRQDICVTLTKIIAPFQVHNYDLLQHGVRGVRLSLRFTYEVADWESLPGDGKSGARIQVF